MSSADHATDSCDYCGLPIGGGANRADVKRQFCCFGCRFAAAVTVADGDAQTSQWTLVRLGLAIFFTMNVMVFTMVLWSRDVYHIDAGDGANASALYELLRFGCLLFATPVLLLLGGPLAEQAWESARRRVITIDGFLALGVIASFAYSAISLWMGGDHIYFEVGCMVLVAVTLGRWLEAIGKLKTTNALRALERLLPDTARLLTGDKTRDVPLTSLQVGDCIRVVAGERIPVDGRLLRGVGTVDQQLITGESQPDSKQPGDDVFGGSLNLDGDLHIRVTATDGTLQRLLAAVEAAATRQGSDQRLADRLAAWFVPLVLAASGLAFWWHFQAFGFHAGLMCALAMLLIACPCALGIATPLAIWAAMGKASRHQLVVRDGDALNRLARVRTVFFDKTGTLTTGTAGVDRLVMDDGTDRGAALLAAATLVSGATHTLSKAIQRYVGTMLRDARVIEIKTHPGMGVSGFVHALNAYVVLGNARLMHDSGFSIPRCLEDCAAAATRQGKSFSLVGWQGKVRGVFVFSEELRPEVHRTLDDLRRMGIRCEVLTGDHAGRAAVIGHELGIEVRSDLLPADKLAAIENAREHPGLVAMVGDGINDAPAMAAADVGIAMGCGADVTRDAGDVCLLGNDLLLLPWSIRLAKRTVSTIRKNLFWAFVYNFVGIGLAATGWLNPVFAAIAMVGSSLLVISNSLMLSAETAGHSSQDATLVLDGNLRRGTCGFSVPAESEKWMESDSVPPAPSSQPHLALSAISALGDEESV